MVRNRSRVLRASVFILLALLPAAAYAQQEPVDLYDLFGSGSWWLVSVTTGDEESSPDAVLGIPFAINAEGGLAGSVGCNQMVAKGELTPDGGAAFGPVTSTLMACPEPAMSLERAFITALESVDAYHREAGRIVLSGPSSEIVFSAAAPRADSVHGDFAALVALGIGLEAFNAAVAEAAVAGAGWVRDPLRVALAFVDLRGAPKTAIEMSVTPGRGAEASIRVEERGLLDDSVEGVGQTVRLELHDGSWRVVSHEMTWFCRRGPQPEVIYPAVCP